LESHQNSNVDRSFQIWALLMLMARTEDVAEQTVRLAISVDRVLMQLPHFEEGFVRRGRTGTRGSRPRS
jgi:hypothetical protein